MGLKNIVSGIVPAVIWMLALLNMVTMAWNESRENFHFWAVAINGLAVCSAFAFATAASRLQGIEIDGQWHDTTTRATRIFVYLMLFCGMVSGSWNVIRSVDWWKTEEPASLPPPPEPVTVDLDGITMYVPPSPPRSPDLPKDLLGAIAEGERLMKAAKFDPDRCLGEGKMHEKCLGSYLLAAVNAAGEFQQVEVMLDHDETKDPKDFYVSTPPNFTVTKESGGGFNVAFRVSAPPGWTVVALRRPYRNAAKEIVADTYIPYSPNLDTEELVAEGARYLGLMLTSASRELRARHVESRHIKGKLVTDVGTNDHVAALVLTEWVYDPQKFVDGDDLVRTQLVNRTLAMFGANRGQAFRFGQSSVGALGIAQVMPGTASGLFANYPEAGMAEIVDWDRVDHQQALKLAILHADDQLYVFGKDREHLDNLRRDPRLFRLVLAAGYNCNFGVIDRVIHARGAQWREPCSKGDAVCVALPLETRQYVEKFEEIHDTLFDPATHDRVAAVVNPPLAAEPKTE